MSNTARKVQGAKSNKAIQLAPDESYTDLGLFRFYKFSTAITTGVTAVPTGSSVGDLATTTHATGQASVFKNIGGVWTAV